MNWSENLPNGCPPSDAKTADPEQIFYRMTRHDPPQKEDFYSQAKAKTQRMMRSNADECTKRGISLFDDLESLKNILHLPRAGKHIVGLTIGVNDGVVLQGMGHHWTWWKTDHFSLNSCRMIVKP